MSTLCFYFQAGGLGNSDLSIPLRAGEDGREKGENLYENHLLL